MAASCFSGRKNAQLHKLVDEMMMQAYHLEITIFRTSPFTESLKKSETVFIVRIPTCHVHHDLVPHGVGATGA